MTNPWQQPLGNNAHLLLVRHHQLERQQAETLVRILRETDQALPDRTHTKGTAAGDKRKMRGIPVVTDGIGGTSPGTDPLAALLAAERKRLRDVH